MAEMTPQEAQAYNEILNDRTKIQSQSMRILQNEYALQKRLGVESEKQNKSEKAISEYIKKSMKNERDAVAQLFKHDKSRYIIEKQRLDTMAKSKQVYQQNAGILKDIRRESDLILKNHRQDIDILKQQGKVIKANAKEWAQGFKDPDTGKASVSSVGKRGVEVAQDPKQMLQAAGPWGMLLGFILEVIDGVRAMTAEMSSASVAGGKFGDTMAQAANEAKILTSNQFEFAKSGLEVKEVAEIYTHLKNTGIEALGVIPQTGNALSKVAQNVIAFAKATGQSYAEIAGQFDDMIRKFGVSNAELENTYRDIFEEASDAAQQGIANVQDFVKATYQIGDAFSDIGVNIKQSGQLIRGVGEALKAMKLGGGIQNIMAVAQGLMGIHKASSGWLAFMAKSSGQQGGFARSLFGAQQRRADFTLPGKGELDINKTFGMLRSVLIGKTQGMADPASRQVLIEQLGQQFGLDTRTTQAFQRMSTGQLGESGVKKEMEAVRRQAEKQNVDAKGMFDILRNILVGLIAKPIIGIYSVVSRWFTKTSDKEKASIAEMQKTLDQVSGETKSETKGRGSMTVTSQNNQVKESAIGSTVKQSGLIMAHAGNIILPMAKTESYKNRALQNANGGVGSIALSIEMRGSNAETAKEVGRKAEEGYLSAIRQQQQANF